MKFDEHKANLSPPEAAYIEDVCLYQAANSIADGIKRKIKSGMLDWAKSILPNDFDSIQGEGRYPTLRFFAVDRWKPEDGETITVELDPEELGTIRQLASLAVMTAKEEAGRVGEDFAVNSILGAAAFPEDAEISALDIDDEETLKSQLFEEKLEAIALGDSIISAISSYGTE